MGLIRCPECGNMISEYAESCVNCGCPKAIFLKSVNIEKTDVSNEEVIEQVTAVQSDSITNELEQPIVYSNIPEKQAPISEPAEQPDTASNNETKVPRTIVETNNLIAKALIVISMALAIISSFLPFISVKVLYINESVILWSKNFLWLTIIGTVFLLIEAIELIINNKNLKRDTIAVGIVFFLETAFQFIFNYNRYKDIEGIDLSGAVCTNVGFYLLLASAIIMLIAGLLLNKANKSYIAITVVAVLGLVSIGLFITFTWNSRLDERIREEYNSMLNTSANDYMEASNKAVDISAIEDFMRGAAAMAADVDYDIPGGVEFRINVSKGEAKLSVSDDSLTNAWVDMCALKNNTYELQSSDFSNIDVTYIGTVKNTGAVDWVYSGDTEMLDYSKDFASMVPSEYTETAKNDVEEPVKEPIEEPNEIVVDEPIEEEPIIDSEDYDFDSEWVDPPDYDYDYDFDSELVDPPDYAFPGYELGWLINEKAGLSGLPSSFEYAAATLAHEAAYRKNPSEKYNFIRPNGDSWGTVFAEHYIDVSAMSIDVYWFETTSSDVDEAYKYINKRWGDSLFENAIGFAGGSEYNAETNKMTWIIFKSCY